MSMALQVTLSVLKFGYTGSPYASGYHDFWTYLDFKLDQTTQIKQKLYLY